MSAIARVALFLIGYFVILVAISVVKGMTPPAVREIAWGVGSAALLYALTRAMLARDGRDAAESGAAVRPASFGRLGLGLVIGLATYALTLLALSVTLGPLHLSAPRWAGAEAWGLMLASTLALSAMEELGFRGYALRTLLPAIGPVRAQLVIALLFGLTHIAYGWPWRDVLLGVIPSGLVFGALALRSGGLAVPIGAHAGVNLAQWMVGEGGPGGVWTVDVAPEHLGAMAAYGAYVGCAVTLGLAAVLMRTSGRGAAAPDGVSSSSRTSGRS